MIDPTLLHYCYAFISSHIYGSRPEGIVTVTLREIERFNATKERLQSYLESQVYPLPTEKSIKTGKSSNPGLTRLPIIALHFHLAGPKAP